MTAREPAPRRAWARGASRRDPNGRSASWSRLGAAAVVLVPLAALAALGGTYPSSTLPLLAGAAVAFLVSGARVASAGESRALDLALMALLAAMLVQLAPLPSAILGLLSPYAPALQDMLLLQPAGPTRPLSIDARLTRASVGSAAAAVLLFWSAREVLARGFGTRIVGVLASAGLAVALIAAAQRATAPRLLLWTWTPVDPGAQPFGPFVNRNHLAAWLLMTSAATVGCLLASVDVRHRSMATSRRLAIRDLLVDGRIPLLAGAAGLMLVALAASGSRAALLGAAVALVSGLRAGRNRAARRPAQRAAAVLVVMLAAGAVWANRDLVGSRLEATLAGRSVDRPVIWRETLPIVADFWLAGTGAGTYAQSMLHYQRTTPDRLFNQAHSEYLQVLAEGGLLLAGPAIAALWLFVGLARRRLGDDSTRMYWLRLGAWAGLVGIAVQCLFESALRLPANALLCAVLAAVVLYPPAEGSHDHAPAQS